MTAEPSCAPYETRIRLDRDKARALRGVIDAAMRRDPIQYAHRMIWTLFGDKDEEKRDFLYVVESESPFVAVVRSRRAPVDRLGIWTIEHGYRLSPILAEGTRLRFRLRAVPVRWSVEPGGRRGKRHDVIMWAWRRLPQSERTDDGLEGAAETAALDWLRKQGEARGFHPEPGTAVLDYDRRRIPGRSAKPISFGTVTYEGILTVTDPAAFRGALVDGVGAARGFGNGMIRIAPAGSLTS
ncbi:MAG: type I-E CRISPR-associated protein Cas6/Cse3/CasE [Telmatospirillum sp.]|nr:type I-E CRISPR-associated protein Cas6/Cse3/CasE [Telmatospirillum sp.]